MRRSGGRCEVSPLLTAQLKSGSGTTSSSFAKKDPAACLSRPFDSGTRAPVRSCDGKSEFITLNLLENFSLRVEADSVEQQEGIYQHVGGFVSDLCDGVPTFELSAATPLKYLKEFRCLYAYRYR